MLIIDHVATAPCTDPIQVRPRLLSKVTSVRKVHKCVVDIVYTSNANMRFSIVSLLVRNQTWLLELSGP